MADRRGARGERQEAAGACDMRSIGLGMGGGGAGQSHGMQHPEGDQVAVGRGVGDVAGAQEGGGGEALAHAHQVAGAARDDVADRGFGLGQQQVAPCWIRVTVVPDYVFFHHRAGCRMGGDVVDPALAQDPDAAPVAQGFPVLRPGSHAAFAL